MPLGTFAGDGDVLAANAAGTSITASYDSGTEILSLSGTDTLAHYQAVLKSVTFATSSANPTNFGANTTPTLTWVLKDPGGTANGGADTSQVTTSVSITPVNDPPVLAGTTANVGFTENDAPVILSPSATVTDPDDTNLSGATVSITAGSFSGDGDLLAASVAGTGITASYDSGTAVLTLSGIDSLAHYQAVLESVSFTNTSDNPDNFGANPTRTLSWVVKDPSSFASTPVATVVDITANNDAPTLAGVPAKLDVTVSSMVALAPAASVTDPDNLDLASATVSITGGTGDVLDADTSGTAFTASYDGTSEVLTLSGPDTLANYQSVLSKVTYTAPASHGTRSVAWQLNDGSGSNNLSLIQTEALDVACFCPGARILTDRGDVPVERLRIGDRVMTMSGDAKPIIWVGQRRLDCRTHRSPEKVWPVRIAAGAFGAGMPGRDLLLSPDHAVLWEGVLVPAKLLVNHASIRQIECDSVTYHHVELARHDVLLAEGLPCETYLDTGNRGMFEGQMQPLVLHPDFASGQRGRETRSCAPFVHRPDDVAPIWRAVGTYAEAAGHRLPQAPAQTDDPDLLVVVGTRRFKPVVAKADRYTFVVPPGCSPVRLVSSAARPNEVRPWVNDARRLGVRVRRVVWHGEQGRCEIAMDDPGLVQGWWAAETDDHGPCRWTNGDALLSVVGAGMLEFELAGTTRYPIGVHGQTDRAVLRSVGA